MCLSLSCVPDPTSSAGDARVEVVRPITLTDAALLPENDPGFLGVEVTDDRLVFAYDGEPADAIRPGHVLAGSAGAGYLRRALSVSRLADGRISVETQHAFLVDLIRDGHFRVTMTPGAERWEETPGTARSALQAPRSLLPEVSACTPNATGTHVFRPYLNASLGMHFDIDIGPHSWLPIGKLRGARVSLEGRIEAGIDFDAAGTLSWKCKEDIMEWLESRGLVIPQLVYPAILPIGPLQVPVTHVLRPTASIAEDILLEVKAGLHPRVSYEIEVGAQYAGGQWTPILDHRHEWSIGPQAEGAAELSVSLATGVAYDFLILGVAGPSVRLEYIIEAALSANSEVCHWRIDEARAVTIGVDTAKKVRPYFDHVLSSWSKTFEFGKKRLDSGPCEACPEETPRWSEDALECVDCPASAPEWDVELRACKGVCSDQVESGGNAPEIRAVDLGQKKGTFSLGYNMFSVPDRIIVEYEGAVLHDTGCKSGVGVQPIEYAGSSSTVLIRVMPACDGSSTEWNFTVSCP